MANIENAAKEIREMDELAAMHSPIHSLHPLAKLIVTIAYIFVTVSFDKYAFSRLMIMILYPALLFFISGVSVKTCFYKLRFILPLICAVGIFNPFFDKTPIVKIGSWLITGGVISMLTLILKGVFALMASFLLVSTTSMDSLCRALRKIHMPGILISLIMLTYRYLTLMMDEVSVMVTAYKLRAPGQKGLHHSAWGSFLGQLLLRNMDKADELYSSMQLRGFTGDFKYAEVKKATAYDILFCIITIALFIVFRNYDLTALIGALVTGGNL